MVGTTLLSSENKSLILEKVEAIDKSSVYHYFRLFRLFWCSMSIIWCFSAYIRGGTPRTHRITTRGSTCVTPYLIINYIFLPFKVNTFH